MSFGQRSEQYMPETRNVNTDNTKIRIKQKTGYTSLKTFN